MSITKKTHERRVADWTAQKKVWEAKLAKATSTNETDFANEMIKEAEGALERLQLVREEEAYEKQNIEPIVKKVKADRKKQDSSTSSEEEHACIIGL